MTKLEKALEKWTRITDHLSKKIRESERITAKDLAIRITKVR